MSKIKINRMLKKILHIAVILQVMMLSIMFRSAPVFAQSYTHDLYITPGDVRVEGRLLKNTKARIYVTVRNNSQFDLSGTVKFYDERVSRYIGTDQPVSVLAGKTDDVFIDFFADITGEHPIAIKVAPWLPETDDPSNNKVRKDIYVDVDTDGDGTGNRMDNDDDNDGVKDPDDAFQLDPSEWKDSDGDGIGDNADIDDDNDNVPDVEDVFPLDPDEWQDSDGDGVGDRSDPFPYNSKETKDSDGDGLGDNADPNDNNKGPVPSIIVDDKTYRVSETVTFSGIKSTDHDGEISTYVWDFGDGSIGEGVLVNHKYEKKGNFIVKLTLTDDAGESRELKTTVKVGWDWFLLLIILIGLLILFFLLGLIHPHSRYHHKNLMQVHSLGEGEPYMERTEEKSEKYRHMQF